MRACVLLCLIALTLVRVQSANAQSDGRFDGWYQIEVIIFERLATDGDEQWPKDITLSYPLNWETLKDPNAPAETAKQQAPGQVYDQEQSLPEAEPISPDLARMPFYTLPANDRVLNRERQRLAARSDLSILFHEAWRQPLSAANTTPAVLVFGGDSYEKYRRLEGSLHIYVTRYLHVQSNLWLTNFQTNAGQTHTPWPEIPLNPQEQLRQLQERGMDDALSTSFFSRPTQQWNALEWETNLPEFLTAAYIPTRIVTLQQSRRMRSNETHYIDHPHLGLLVRITPYQLPTE